MKQRLDHLDVMRGFAILGVLLFHSLDAAWAGNSFPWRGGVRNISMSLNGSTAFWLYPSHLGHLGVAIFFAVSGFCIHYSQIWSNTPRPGLDFFIKRFFRIVPPYLAVLLILGLHGGAWHDVKSLHGFVLHLFLIHNFSSSHVFGLSPSFWSIAVEVQLYILYPLLWYCAYRIGWFRTLLITMAVELTLRSTEIVMGGAYGTSLPQYITGSPFYFWFSWTAGAYAAEMHRSGEKLAYGVTAGWLCVLLGFSADTWKISSEISFTLVAAGSAILLLSDWNLPGRLRKWPILLGAWSYSLYLIHQPILQKVGALLKGSGNTSLLVLGCVWAAGIVTVLVAGIMFHTIEKPSIEIGRWVKLKVKSSNESRIRRHHAIQQALATKNANPQSQTNNRQ